MNEIDISFSTEFSTKKWTDNILYWTWNHEVEYDKCGNVLLTPSPPTVKKIDYAFNNDKKINLAIGVWDNEKYTPLNRKELSDYMTSYAFDDDVDKNVNSILIKNPYKESDLYKKSIYKHLYEYHKKEYKKFKHALFNISNLSKNEFYKLTLKERIFNFYLKFKKGIND